MSLRSRVEDFIGHRADRYELMELLAERPWRWGGRLTLWSCSA